MVSTRSQAKRANSGHKEEESAAREPIDALAQVTTRRGTSSVRAASAKAGSQPAAAAPAAEEDNTFRVASVVDMTPKAASQQNTPAKASTPRPEAAPSTITAQQDANEPLAAPAAEASPGTQAPRASRRLSMRELVQQVQGLPLPDEDQASEEAAAPPRTSKRSASPHQSRPKTPPASRAKPAPRTHASLGATATGVLLLLAASATVAGLALAALCTQAGQRWVHACTSPTAPLPWLQRAAELHCAHADAMLVQPLRARLRLAVPVWQRATQHGRAWAGAQTARLAAELRGQWQQARAALRARAGTALSSPAGAAALRWVRAARVAALRAPRVLSPLSEVLPPAALAALTLQPPGDQLAPGGWVEAEDVLLHAEQGSVRGKATGLLLACSASPRDDCAATLARLTGAVRLPQHLLVVEGAEGAGEVQQRLAEFLDKSPTGVVVLAAPRWLPARVWGVLSNALSEGGALQLDGRVVGASRALFVVLLPLAGATPPSGAGSAVGAPEWFEAEAKAELQRLVAGDGDEAGRALGLALRRRFEFVLVTPGAMDAAAEAANELAAAQAAAALAATEAQAAAEAAQQQQRLEAEQATAE